MQKTFPNAKQGFSLVELLVVCSIVAAMVGIAAPLVTGIVKSNGLNSASRQVSNLFAVARSEAINKGTLTRFVVCTDWENNETAAFRRMSVWVYNRSTENWGQLTKWEEVPKGVMFDSEAGSYLQNSSPANGLLSPSVNNNFNTEVGGKNVQTKYIEFLPTGAAQTPGATGPDIWVGLADQNSVESDSDISTPKNWSRISASTLTGRLKISRP